MIDRGSAWVRRRFAKPIVSGSIPATVSIFRAKFGQPLWGRGHRFQLGQAFAEWISAKQGGAFLAGVRHGFRFPATAARFPADYEKQELADLVIQHRDAAIAVSTSLSEMRDRLITVQKELSALKRKSKGDGQ